jgi:uncharacterized protein YecT (DUF1311 family)
MRHRFYVGLLIMLSFGALFAYSAYADEVQDQALVSAAQKGMTEEIRRLLDAGAHVDSADKDGLQAIHYSAWSGNIKVVKLMLAAGAKVDAINYQGLQPIHYAALNGSAELVKVLLAAGAKVDASDRNGQQPLHLASSKSNIDAVKALVAAGANLEAEDITGRPPIYLAAADRDTDDPKTLEVVRVLLAAGAKANPTDRQGNHLIQNIEQKGRTEMVNRLTAAWLVQVYQTLLQKVSVSDRSKIEESQRAWIKESDAACRSDAKETDREKHGSITKNHTETRCIISYSKARTIELNDMMPLVGGVPHTHKDHLFHSDKERDTGLWYYETILKVGELTRTGDIEVRLVCGESKTHTSVEATIYMDTATAASEALVAVAVDLDRGKFYHSLNGEWQGGAPGSNDGINMKLGRSWQCGIYSTAILDTLLKKQYIDVNFGERPFIYKLPPGYKPFGSEPIWMFGGIGDKDMRLSFDYRSFNIKGDKPSFAARREDPELSTLSESDKKYKAIQYGLEIDCNTKMVQSRGGSKVDQKVGLDNVGGRLIESLCFLKKYNFDLPDIDANDEWEPMLSPSPLIKISEAINRRQYRNGYLLVKQRNDTSIGAEVLGEQSKQLVMISAFNCVDHTMHVLIVARYGDHGNVLGADYYHQNDSAPKLPQNKIRFETACAAMSTARVHDASATEPAFTSNSLPELVSRGPESRAPKRSNTNRDMRNCLELKTNAEIIACTGKQD